MSPPLFLRHAELVSASIPPRASALLAQWTLKRVQGDDALERTA
jgi:hypothetical protein